MHMDYCNDKCQLSVWVLEDYASGQWTLKHTADMSGMIGHDEVCTFVAVNMERKSIFFQTNGWNEKLCHTIWKTRDVALSSVLRGILISDAILISQIHWMVVRWFAKSSTVIAYRVCTPPVGTFIWVRCWIWVRFFTYTAWFSSESLMFWSVPLWRFEQCYLKRVCYCDYT